MDDDLTIPDFLIATEEKHLRAWRGFKVKKPAAFIAEDKHRRAWIKLQKEKQRARLAKLRAR
jgi:hypothetical protein